MLMPTASTLTGKGSWRFTQAGADISIVSSPEKTACIEQRPLTFQQVISKVHDVDLILVEGFKNEPLTQIGICRKETGTGFRRHCTAMRRSSVTWRSWEQPFPGLAWKTLTPWQNLVWITGNAFPNMKKRIPGMLPYSLADQ